MCVVPHLATRAWVPFKQPNRRATFSEVQGEGSPEDGGLGLPVNTKSPRSSHLPREPSGKQAACPKVLELGEVR